MESSFSYRNLSMLTSAPEDIMNQILRHEGIQEKKKRKERGDPAALAEICFRIFSFFPMNVSECMGNTSFWIVISSRCFPKDSWLLQNPLLFVFVPNYSICIHSYLASTEGENPPCKTAALVATSKAAVQNGKRHNYFNIVKPWQNFTLLDAVLCLFCCCC